MAYNKNFTRKTKKHSKHYQPPPNNKPVTVCLPKFAPNDLHFLNNHWHIYAHDKRDADFTDDSYKRCFTIETLEDFWLFFNHINDFTTHQFYIMRKNIEPKYEVQENIHGGTLSFLILENIDVKPTLIRTVLRMICEKLIGNKRFYYQITGMYLNPKVNGANLKIWFGNFEWLQNNVHLVEIADIVALKSRRISKHNNIVSPRIDRP